MSQYLKEKYKSIVYVDEVGRGCLAGPVVACAVIITAQAKCKVTSSKFKAVRLGDSKKLTQKQREEVYEVVTRIPYIKWAVASVYPKTIDEINIFEASRLAAKRAIQKLSRRTARPGLVVLDGNFTLRMRTPQRPVVKADEKFLPCSIASIIAKVTRDWMMIRLARKFPHYGFNVHKGYGTKLHYDMLKKHGPSPIHRRSFRLA